MIDFNCDMGEGMRFDREIMPFITSANIACGFHAGNNDIIRSTIDLALEHNVHVGAHPSFHDRQNFGRKEMNLPADKLYAIVIEQLIRVDLVAKERGAVLHHVKPHGALYNMAARDPKIALVIAQAVKDFNEDLILYGLSGSCLIKEGRELELKTASEVFADRTYSDDGSLTPRDHPFAVIEEESKCLQQVMQMVQQKTVTSLTGKLIPLQAETICLHSDTRHAVIFARKIQTALLQQFPIGKSILSGKDN